MKNQIRRISAVILAVMFLAVGCGSDMPADKKAGETDNVNAAVTANEDLTPICANQLKEGVYAIRVDSSSSMFRITACDLTVRDGVMSAVMTMGGTGYLKLYMGTGEAASGADESDYIPFAELASGEHTFEVPVAALDLGLDCSAFSKNKEEWYDRILVFRSDSLPDDAFAEGEVITAESLELEDGRYTAAVTLAGGSGRASVESPAVLVAESGQVYATIIWSSSNYDYMIMNEEKYMAVNTEGNSTFEIPVGSFDRKIPVIANTIAMSEPHEVEYTLIFDAATIEKVE